MNEKEYLDQNEIDEIFDMEELSYEFAKDHYKAINEMSKDEILRKVLTRKYANLCKLLSEEKIKEILTEKAKNTIDYYELRKKTIEVF